MGPGGNFAGAAKERVGRITRGAGVAIPPETVMAEPGAVRLVGLVKLAVEERSIEVREFLSARTECYAAYYRVTLPGSAFHSTNRTATLCPFLSFFMLFGRKCKNRAQSVLLEQ